MSIWAEIKKAINGSLGRADFNPLDEIMEIKSHECYYQTMSAYVAAYGDNSGGVVVVPKQLSIPYGTYNGDTSIKSLILPNGLKTIANDAFSGCSNLHHVKFPIGLQSIGSGAFRGTRVYGTGIEFYEGLLSIDDDAFAGKFKTAILPSTIASLGHHSISADVVKIYAKTPPTIYLSGDESFDNVQTVYVPSDVLSTYKSKWASASFDIIGF